MPDVRLVPKDKAAGQRVAAVMADLRKEIKIIITEARPDLKPHEVLVSLELCPFMDPDPDLADILLTVHVCKTPATQAVADAVIDKIGKTIVDHGLTVDLMVDHWIQLHSGPFLEIKDGETLDQLSLAQTS